MCFVNVWHYIHPTQFPQESIDMHTSQLCLFGRKPNTLFLGLLSINAPAGAKGVWNLWCWIQASAECPPGGLMLFCLFVCLLGGFSLSSERARVRNWYWCGPSQSITLSELDIVCFSSDHQALGSTTARLLLQRLPVCGHFWRKNKSPSQYPSQWLLIKVRVRVRFKFGTSTISNFTPVMLYWRGFYVCYRD